MGIIIETTDAPNLSRVANPSSPYLLTLGDSFTGRLDGPGSTGDYDFVAVALEVGYDYFAVLELDTQTPPNNSVNLGFGNARQISESGIGFLGDQLREGRTFVQSIRPDEEDAAGAFAFVQDVSYEGRYRLTLARDDAGDASSLARVDGQGRYEGAIGLVAGGVLVETEGDLVGAELEAGTDYTFNVTFDDATGLTPGLFTLRGADGSSVDGADDAFAFVVGGEGEFNFTPTDSGLYFAQVAGTVADAPAAYTVTIAAPQGLDFTDDDNGNVIPGTARPDRIDGAGGDDRITGLAGNDTLIGGTGIDTLDGGEGDDLLNGGADRDVLIGGAGDDVYVIDDRRDIVSESAEGGFDTVRTSTQYAIGSAVERLEALGGGNLRLDSNFTGQDLVGNGGSNILVGFGGEDTMTGGGGRDVFVINPSGRQNDATSIFTPPEITVTDFTRGQDRIAVDDQLLGLGAPGIDVRDFTGAIFRDIRDAGLVGYNARTGELRIDYDGDGDRELVATLEGGTALGFDDVILF